MQATSGSYVDGITYRFDFQPAGGLASGKYLLVRVLSSGGGRDQQGTFGPMDGPYVNSAPRLSAAAVKDPEGNVSPTGSRSKQYTYEVRYHDDENNAPSQVRLTINKPDGTKLGDYNMTARAGSGTDYKGAGVLSE